jgi:hypothetical protein
MAIPTALQLAARTWSSYYGNHQAVSISIKALHLAGTMVGGGAAIALDRQVLRALRQPPGERHLVLAQLQGAHRVVVPAFVLILLTGVLMAGADLETFMGSTLFWAKAALTGVLALNGLALVAVESSARSTPTAWGRVAAAATISLALWFVILYLGTWLTVAA